jgi:hypothetical protein
MPPFNRDQQTRSRRQLIAYHFITMPRPCQTVRQARFRVSWLYYQAQRRRRLAGLDGTHVW